MPVASRKELSHSCSIGMQGVPRSWFEAVGVMVFILLGLIMLMLIRTPAAAQDQDEAIDRIAVHYTIDDLQNPAKARQLLGWIDRAALRACGDVAGESDTMRAAVAQSDCRRDSVLRAVARVHSPMLTQVASDYDFWVRP
ncbi:UrcA family protein [Gluconacetobacter tumulisoli]|uniref:UrcA family protein n=1 Tax=Gluconacetobacter tumulisoli TaxID=1286189 RepID=A0A7W4K923_9PROT|nr:UrcA family protein [Gluconacetobacter tumulisoli]MBB2202530.1 UrcA family protein [Gluconacetobacter tumulisoli]